MAELTQAEVHEALTRLGDYVRLAQAPLVSHFPQLESVVQLDERAEKLRAILLEAIEALGPPRPTSFGSPESRAREALTMRYVEEMSIEDMAAELSVSRRQVYRDLGLAEKRLTQLLSSWACPTQQGPQTAVPGDTIGEELSLFSSRPAEVQLRRVLDDALSLVQPLANELGVKLKLVSPLEERIRVVGDLAFTRQVLVRALSLAVQATTAGKIAIGAEVQDERVVLHLGFSAPEPFAFAEGLETIRRITQSQGMACEALSQSPGKVDLTLTLCRRAPKRVLIVEDNPGAVELYRRYLPVEDWQVEATSDSRVAFELIKALKPHVVILDIMMPHVDGWTVLRDLKENPQTRRTPIVICSIANDPMLARALGAAASLSKPVSQAQLLVALHRCLGE